jgi:hypothetical protein
MSYKETPLKEYFCLKTKESFSLDPWMDGEQFFGDIFLAERIRKRIENDFVQPRGVPKFIVHGGWGSGKTHTLAHIKHILDHGTMYPAEPVYLDIAPLGTKERWQRIHNRLIDAVGLERVQQTIETVAEKIKGADKVEGLLEQNLLPFGDETLKYSQANVLRNMLFGGRQMQLSWEWLKGSRNSPDQAVTIGVQKDLVEPSDFVNCLVNIGRIYHYGSGKKIVFLVDEAEALRSITTPDSINEIIHMLRLLLENSNCYVGIVLAVQVEAGMESIGEFFGREDIRRRLDYDQGYIDLENAIGKLEDADRFIHQTLQYLVDQERAASIIKKESLATSTQDFPFTQDAIMTLSSHVASTPDAATPAFILSTMTTAAIEAWRRRETQEGHILVESETVEQTIFPGA